MQMKSLATGSRDVLLIRYLNRIITSGSHRAGVRNKAPTMFYHTKHTKAHASKNDRLAFEKFFICFEKCVNASKLFLLSFEDNSPT